MTTRVKGLVVTLDRDIREDDVQAIINAIAIIKGVQDVSTNVVKHDDYINRMRIKSDLERDIYKSISEVFKTLKD